MLNIIQRGEFKTSCTAKNSFQANLDKDVQEIRQDKNIYVKADKTTNHYKAEPQDYLNLLHKNVTKAYKKTNKNIPDSITSADKKIAEDLQLDDRIEVSASRDAFITLKDHKPDFTNNPTCRLINPAKSEIGIISKHILDNINKEITKVTKANLWRSTSNVIEWFQAIPNKSQHAFITFDVQYRSEISGLCTRKMHAPFLRKCVLKNACNIRVCAHLMRVFPFVIHSHNCALCGIRNKQNKRQFQQTPLKGYFHRQRNSRCVFPLPYFLIGLYYPITKRMINKLEFLYIWFYNS